MVTKTIQIQDVHFDEALYPRNQKNGDWSTIYRYQEAMRSGSVFPPITVAKHEGKLFLIDGWHRVQANKQLKTDYIQAEILTGLSEQQIFVESVKRNIEHGQNLSLYDKLKASNRFKQYGMQAKEISGILHIPIKSLERYETTRMTNTFSGETVVLKAALKHLAGKQIPNENMLDEQKFFNVQSQIALLEQFMVLLDNDWLNRENPRVRELVEKIEEHLQGSAK